MADKKEMDPGPIESSSEQKKQKEAQGADGGDETFTLLEESGQSEKLNLVEEQLSSLDLLWRHAFQELDEWAAQLEFHDEVLLKEAMCFVDSMKRNQGNVKTVAEQFNKEFMEWEKAARDEFLMATTTLQHFFPKKSYEEINEQIELIQKRTLSILKTPYQAVTNNQLSDRYLQLIEQYIALRKKGRQQYIKSIKQAANLIYENQKGFVHLFTKQIKSLMFPLNRYLEKPEELTKS